MSRGSESEDRERAVGKRRPHRMRHARALPGGQAYVPFGDTRLKSDKFVSFRHWMLVDICTGPASHFEGHTTRARARTLPGWHSLTGHHRSPLTIHNTHRPVLSLATLFLSWLLLFEHLRWDQVIADAPIYFTQFYSIPILLYCLLSESCL